MPNAGKPSERILDIAVLIFAVGAVGLAVIIFLGSPAIFAMTAAEATAIEWVAGIAALLLVALPIGVFATDAAARIYGFRRPWLIRRPTGRYSFRLGEPLVKSPAAAILSVAASYLLTLYVYALIFCLLSSVDRGAFNERLGLGAAIYFSVVTAATVGYGDIQPLSVAARTAVVAEILTSFAYASFLFSVAAGRAWRAGDAASSRPQDDPSGKSKSPVGSG